MLTIRYNLLMRGLGVFCGMLAAALPFLCGLTLWLIPSEPGRTIPMIHTVGPWVGMILIGVVAFRETRRGYAVFSEEGVEQYSPWCGRTKIPWSEVEKVVIYANGYVIIRGRKRRAAFGWYWTNRAAMMAMIQRQVGPKLKRSAL